MPREHTFDMETDCCLRCLLPLEQVVGNELRYCRGRAKALAWMLRTHDPSLHDSIRGFYARRAEGRHRDRAERGHLEILIGEHLGMVSRLDTADRIRWEGMRLDDARRASRKRRRPRPAPSHNLVARLRRVR